MGKVSKGARNETGVFLTARGPFVSSSGHPHSSRQTALSSTRKVCRFGGAEMRISSRASAPSGAADSEFPTKVLCQTHHPKGRYTIVFTIDRLYPLW